MSTDIDWENDTSRIENPHVLLIDDEPLILKNLEMVLLRKGCRITAAGSGEQGIARAFENPPDAILLDVMMPDMDGYQVCRRIKNNDALRHIPVIMITALNDVFSKVKGLDAGADDFISKPFNEAELRARLWAHLRNKMLHDRLSESYRRLKELEEMKESLTHMIMHDVSAPLTAVQVGLEAAIEALDDKREFSDAHERMLRTSMLGCRRVVDMLSDVLMVQRLEEHKFPLSYAIANLNSLTAMCLTMLEPVRASAKVHIRVDMDPALPSITGDETLLARVITNLVSNSLKFTDAGGHISIRMWRSGINEVAAEISDDGVGIPSEQLNRIFDKFAQSQTHHSRKGVGLGLTFCRLAIEAHAGRIWAENNVDHGSRFMIRLPITPPINMAVPLAVLSPAS